MIIRKESLHNNHKSRDTGWVVFSHFNLVKIQNLKKNLYGCKIQVSVHMSLKFQVITNVSEETEQLRKENNSGKFITLAIRTLEHKNNDPRA